MNCGQFRKCVSDIMDDDIHLSITNALLKHTQDCTECNRFYSEFKNMAVSLKSLGANDVPENCWPAVKQRILQGQKSKLPNISVMWRYIAVPAAAGLILFSYILFSPRETTTQYSASTNSSAYSDYINIHAGAGANQPLSDSDIYLVAAGMQDVGDK